MPFATPPALKHEHAALHADLAAAVAQPGEVGEASRAVAALLHPHFVKEEEFALPLLGLLSDLTEGKAVAAAPTAIAMAERLKRELPQMLAEHRAILAALDRLSAAARAANDTARLGFADSLKHHALSEEQVMYPAAILVGALLRLQQAAVSTARPSA